MAVSPTPRGNRSAPPSKVVATEPTLQMLPSKDSNNNDEQSSQEVDDDPDTKGEPLADLKGGKLVGVAAAIGTAGLIHDAVRFEDSTSGTLVLEAGAALLEAFEHVPFVAPAAFLIGAVARASMEAVVLREDCRAFAETTKRVERAMLKARSMENQREPVETIVNVLEESLALVKHLASRGVVASVVRACKDAKKLAEFKEGK